MKSKIINSPLRYPGGKSRTAKHIIDGIVDFAEYREPFVGGASVFFNLKQKFPTKKFWINDLYPELYTFWSLCKKDLKSVVQQVKKWKTEFPDGKELYNFLCDNRQSFNELELAAFFFILNRITFSGTTESGGYSDQAFRLRFTNSSIDRLEKMEGLFEDVTITNNDYKTLIEAPGEDVFMFLDPPYYSPKNGLYGRKGSMHNGFNHEELAETLKSTPHKWLITYDDCEYIRNLYSYANIFAWDLNYAMCNWTKVTGDQLKKKEIIITNYVR